MKERTLSIIKPDGVSRNLVGEVIKRLEESGLKIVGIKMIKMTKEQAKGFYKVHEGKPFYEALLWKRDRFYVIRSLRGHFIGGRGCHQEI